jgi:hypothetical protein
VQAFLKFDAADAMSLLVRINLVLGLVSAGLTCLFYERAAARATDRADLNARLSVELDAESDRAAFAQRCRQLPSA